MTDALDGAIAAIWERNKPYIAQRVEAVEAAAGAGDAEAREEGAREAHKLAGSLGSFGFHEGSELARELERLLGAGDLPPADAARAAALAARLRKVLPL